MAGQYQMARALMVMSQTFFCYLTGWEEQEDVQDTPIHVTALRAGARLGAGRRDDEHLATSSSSASSGVATGSGKSPREGGVGDHDEIMSSPPRSAASTAGSVGGGFVTPVKGASDAAPAAAAGSSAAPALAPPTIDSGGKPGVRKLYAQSLLKEHPIWNSAAYWEAAVCETLGLDVATAAAAVPAAAAGKSHESKSEQARMEREMEVTTGQLGFFAFNMMAFGVPLPQIRLLLEKYGRAMRLNDSGIGHLMASINRFAAEHRRQSAQEDADRDARFALRSAAATHAAAPSL